MNPALLVSKTGLQAQETKLQVIANNLANVNTMGFKRDAAVFEDQFYEMARMPGSISEGDNRVPSGVQLGTGVRFLATHKQFTDGSLTASSQQYDVAIQGNGFFQVLQADGTTAYTRAGALHPDQDGRLVDANGLPVQPEITIPTNNTGISISATGQVTATISGSSTPEELGTLQLATFMNSAGLQAIGDNLYLATAASGDAVVGDPGEPGFGSLKQFALESSNVKAVEEMVDMISTQRAYEMNTKVLSAADDMMRNLAQAA